MQVRIIDSMLSSFYMLNLDCIPTVPMEIMKQRTLSVKIVGNCPSSVAVAGSQRCPALLHMHQPYCVGAHMGPRHALLKLKLEGHTCTLELWSSYSRVEQSLDLSEVWVIQRLTPAGGLSTKESYIQKPVKLKDIANKLYHVGIQAEHFGWLTSSSSIYIKLKSLQWIKQK